MSEASTKPDAARAASLESRVSAVEQAWDVAQGWTDGKPSGWGYIIETFADDSYVVVSDNGKFWRVDFSDGDGGIEFEAKEKWSELRHRWVRKSGVSILVYGEDETILEQTVRALEDEATRGGDAAEHTEEGTDVDSTPSKGVPVPDPALGGQDGASVDNCGPRGRPIRSLGENRVGEYLVLWGSPEELDFYETYFSPETEEFDNIYRAVGKIPIFYHHAMHEEVKTSVIGLVDVMLPDSIGLWVEGELDKASKYREDIKHMLSLKSLWWSSGTLPGAVDEIAEDGWIPRWPIVDASMTPQPAEYRMVDRPIEELRALYKAAGLTFPNAPEPTTPDNQEAERARAIECELGLLELMDL